MELELTNLIINNKRYLSFVNQLEELEKNRIFCGHDMEHFLSVARITVILCEKNGIDADPDVIYSAALLHDIGRIEEYTNGIPHDEASIVTAAEILGEIGCPENKKNEIIKLISSHRRSDNSDTVLEALFYTADKISRSCFSCKAKDKCKWPEHKRNYTIGV